MRKQDNGTCPSGAHPASGYCYLRAQGIGLLIHIRDLYKIISLKGRDRGWGQRDLISAGSLPEWLEQQGFDKAEARSQALQQGLPCGQQCTSAGTWTQHGLRLGVCEGSLC